MALVISPKIIFNIFWIKDIVELLLIVDVFLSNESDWFNSELFSLSFITLLKHIELKISNISKISLGNSLLFWIFSFFLLLEFFSFTSDFDIIFTLFPHADLIVSFSNPHIILNKPLSTKNSWSFAPYLQIKLSKKDSNSFSFLFWIFLLIKIDIKFWKLSWILFSYNCPHPGTLSK